ncbi:mevalonate kinase [Nematocida sp. LUAm3]|nr:mevalonate kinase [Nematocida sp. LUAm3]KAI5173581.1 mevalonate kinase [Nematocida sp. LUAm2]KAI5176802.1 mevalonate kinase [Nematocida sp. LUAm1]
MIKDENLNDLNGPRKHVFTVKVPCKLILFGEHSSSSVFPCIAVSLSLWTRGKIYVTEGVQDPGKFTIKRKKTSASVPGVIHKLPRGVKVEIHTEVQVACGLGSSAVLSVVIGAANEAHRFITSKKKEKLFVLTDKKRKRISRDAYSVENRIGDKVSGIDHSVIINGGVISYKASDKPPAIKQIFSSIFKDNAIVLWRTSYMQSTPLSLTAIKEDPQWKETRERIAEISYEAEKELSKNEPSLKRIYQYMRETQCLLHSAGFSSPEIEREVEKMRETGVEAQVVKGGAGGYLYSIVPREFDLRPGWFFCEVDRDGLDMQHST